MKGKSCLLGGGMTALSDRIRQGKRFIPSEEIQAVSDWNFGDMGEGQASSQSSGLTDQESIVALSVLTEAREHAYAEGYALAESIVRTECDRRFDDFVHEHKATAAQQLAAVMRAAEYEMGSLQRRLSEDVLKLVCLMARKLIDAELSAQPEKLLPLIEKIIKPMCADHQITRVRLHPSDHALLHDMLEAEFAGKLKIDPDANLTAGGFVAESGSSVVDARIEKRWQRMLLETGLSEVLDFPDQDRFDQDVQPL